MKRYKLQHLSSEQRRELESVLLEELECQTWYSIFFFPQSKTEIFICLH